MPVLRARAKSSVKFFIGWAFAQSGVAALRGENLRGDTWIRTRVRGFAGLVPYRLAMSPRQYDPLGRQTLRHLSEREWAKQGSNL